MIIGEDGSLGLNDEEVDKLLEAGRIARIVREEAAKTARPGMKLLKLAEYVEGRIKELGGEPAFPVNLSINEVAAHYTPVINDEIVIPDEAVLKIDLGVHVDGYIADTAVTVSFNSLYEGLLEASRQALENALSILRPGLRANEIGKTIEDTIKSMGYKPIKNLTGHSIGRWLIHSGMSIPNYNDRFARWRLQDGVYAIEPFATDGVGLVREGSIITIYSLIPRRRMRATARELAIYRRIWTERKTLPFTERWYKDTSSSVEGLRSIFKQMMNHGLLHGYPVLIERGRGMVAQFEHTFIIRGKDVIVTTK